MPRPPPVMATTLPSRKFIPVTPSSPGALRPGGPQQTNLCYNSGRCPSGTTRDRERVASLTGTSGKATTSGQLGRAFSGAVAIVGAADIVSPTGELDHDGRALEMLAVLDALDDAGLTLADVDGVVSAGPMLPLQTAEYMGIRPRWTDGTQVGGCSFETHVEHAMLALAA